MGRELQCRFMYVDLCVFQDKKLRETAEPLRRLVSMGALGISLPKMVVDDVAHVCHDQNVAPRGWGYRWK